MAQNIDQIILKLRNRYEILGLVNEIKKGYRIGIGKTIEIYCDKSISQDIESSLLRDAKPFSIWVYT